MFMGFVPENKLIRILRRPDLQSREPAFEFPFATVSKIRYFRSLHDAPVHLAVQMITGL